MYPNVEVIAGSNLAMVLEICMYRKQGMDVQTLASIAIQIGKEQIIQYTTQKIHAYIEKEDGI